MIQVEQERKYDMKIKVISTLMYNQLLLLVFSKYQYISISINNIISINNYLIDLANRKTTKETNESKSN